MAQSWAELPMRRVVRVCGPLLPMDPLPASSPAILTYRAEGVLTARGLVADVLDELETAALAFYPAWLPGAADLDGPGGAGVLAVRELALRTAAVSSHFGPFLADLAERSIGGVRRPRPVAAETRAAGLARVLAASYGRPHAAILVEVPAGLSAAGQEALVSGCEWLAQHGGLGVWLTGAPLAAVDRIPTLTLTVRLPARPTAREAPARPRYPAMAGKPHPGSPTEQALERALARCPWAVGREWNQPYQPGPLDPLIRVDLLWREERCVVELDGSDHLRADRFEKDHARDVLLVLDGYAVMRFTNDRVATDLPAVLHQLERFLVRRRKDLT